MSLGKEQTFEPGTLIPRGLYIRKCETGLFNKQHFAKQADKERELRLALSEPKNWLSLYFSKEPTRQDLAKFMDELVLKMAHANYDTIDLENWILENLK